MAMATPMDASNNPRTPNTIVVASESTPPLERAGGGKVDGSALTVLITSAIEGVDVVELVAMYGMLGNRQLILKRDLDKYECQFQRTWR